MAEHKEDSTLPGLTAERAKAVILLAVQLYSLIQTGLSLAGISQLPFTSDEVSTAITGVIALVTSVWSWWRNNNVTEAAYTGSQLTKSIKNGDLTTTQGTGAAPDVKPVDDTSLYARDENGDVVYDPLTNTPVINVE